MDARLTTTGSGFFPQLLSVDLTVRNTSGQFLAGIFCLALLTLFFSSCKPEPKNTPWLSLNFAGKFSGNDVCLVSGSQPDTINIAAAGAAQVNITNLYGSGKTFTGNLSNDSCYIPSQFYNNGTGNTELWGSFVLTSDTINLFLIVSTFGHEDKCSAVLVKQ